MKTRIMAVAGVVLLATFGYVPPNVPLGEYVGSTAVFAQECTKQSLCAWVNVLIYKFEFCIETDSCEKPQ